nr:putative ribonuclease H-like domain-containing protein [Tanacetum cinerariifolium]
MSYLSNFEEINGGYVAFGGNQKGGKISGKCKIRTSQLDLDDVYFVKELKFNLFSVSQICDKKNNVLFTNTKCIVLSLEFKLPDENQVLLRVLRENNMYNIDLKNIVPSGALTFLFAKATLDESNLWHRRLGHINFKTINKLVKGNRVRGLPSKVFENNHTCVACKKGKQHRASCKSKPISSVSQPLQRLHMDLFGPTFVKSLNKKRYCLVVTDDYSRFNWVFFLATKDETSPIVKTFITGIEYQLSLKNTDDDVTFVSKKPEFKEEKPESEVYVSSSSSTHIKKHDDKTKREAKSKNHVEFTNTFSADGPSNTAVSQTHGKSSYVDTSQYPDDPNMTELEDITYFDDEEDVGAEADFTNLETTITVSPIPTTRVHKDHPMTQIIGDLSSATQTRSMTRVLKDQGGATSIQDAKGLGLVDLPNGKRAIEVIALVARIEAIRLFLAYASFLGFMVYQMDVKSAFLYGNIEEEVYVCQPPRFQDPDYPDKVYKVVKTLYELHQAPRAWKKGDILLVQIYVDDIIFGSTYKDLCKAFEKLMKDKFHMSSIGELKFFLGLQVKQKPYGIFINQDKYVAEILRKFGLTGGKLASTPIDTEKPLLKDPDGEDVDVHTYRSMIGSLILISWQCKKQTVITTSSTEAEYVAAASCCAQVLWIQNQLLDDGKKVIITEATLREALRLDNAESVDCLPNEEIFTELSRMGTSLNEFSSSMASAVICLSIGMIVAQQADDVADEGATSVDVDAIPAGAEPSILSPTPTTQPPPPSQELPSIS